MPETMVPADYVTMPVGSFNEVYVGDFVITEDPGSKRTYVVMDIGNYLVKPDGTKETTKEQRVLAKLVDTTNAKIDKVGSVWSWPTSYTLTPKQQVLRAPTRERAVTEVSAHGGAADSVPAAFAAPSKGGPWKVLLGVTAGLVGVGGLLWWLSQRKPSRGMGEAPEMEWMGSLGRGKPRLSRKARQFISRKIPTLRREGYPKRQAVAIAYEMARKQGFHVPDPSDLGADPYPAEMQFQNGLGRKTKSKRIRC
ncbi:MAG TPA: hypothetical protein VEK15_20495 [Vicinamibacteria bacterium]|nr:hypothetical protein [Vicinamibacteria bacterium]